MTTVKHVVWLPRSRAAAVGQYQSRLWCTFEASMVGLRDDVTVSVAGYAPSAVRAHTVLATLHCIRALFSRMAYALCLLQVGRAAPRALAAWPAPPLGLLKRWLCPFAVCAGEDFAAHGALHRLGILNLCFYVTTCAPRSSSTPHVHTIANLTPFPPHMLCMYMSTALPT
jgi:hypothetical protein